MKKFKIFIKTHGSAALLCAVVLVVSCTDKFDEINTNKNALADLQTSQLPFLFSAAQQQGTNSGWSYQVAQNLFHDQYAQYFANSTTYFPSDRLVIRMDWIGSLWSPLYTSTMPQLQTLMLEYDPSSAENALANIWWVISFQRVTDSWGPIPYFQAGQPGTGVPYDPQDLIYDDFFKRLDDAVTVLEGKTGDTPYGNFDLVYGGDVSKWIKFANTLRLRLAVRISKVDPTRARTEGEAAVASGVMTTSPSDDALIQKSVKGGDINGLSVMDWNEFRMSSAMESVLKGYDDPRTPIYFNPTLNSIKKNEAANGGTYNPDDLANPLEYHGMRNGLSSAQMAEPLNSADATSRHGERWNSASADKQFLGKTYPAGWSVPSNVIAAAEAYFLRAEGVLLGWNMGGGTAKTYYEGGITASMNQWGITDPTVISDYINSTATPVAPMDALGSPPLSDVPVLFGSTPDVQLEQITLQKWLALYPDGNEAWADIRRSGTLKLYPVVNSDNPELPDPTTQSIRRINFMLSEKQTNSVEVEKAIPLLGTGGDKITTPLWWDTN
ncbi:MAG: SusD/RagB family nutrient-binding outer membrane lipoprotein [Cyclobacteriaceae bacterium]